ncbi:MAG: P-II family nitrogen regulator [Clostridia bacterium]|nr:P-II family nitrogen regulator [Clostridia bacterium]
MTKNKHEVIFAIVNAGYAEDAMRVAREEGARGGTILNGRGVANEKEAAFFGITIHAEKELLMLVVEKEIRDRVLHALYKQMGMQQKAQGIVFSLPVSEAAGLLAKESEDKKEQ